MATDDPFALFGYVGAGLVFGFVAWFSGRLSLTIVGHGLYNGSIDITRVVLS